MFSSLKREVKSKLIFEFIEKDVKPISIEILGIKNDIPIDSSEIEIDLTDFIVNDYKIYECKIIYKNNTKINSITVYYDKINYFICGNGEGSAEIIFSDFLNKTITAEKCVIKYKKERYFPKEDFKVVTRKRINFINIDIEQLELPNDIDDNKISIDSNENKNFLISISIINMPKVIGIYTNEPFIEENLNIDEDEIKTMLKNAIETTHKIINYDKNQQFLNYSYQIDNSGLEKFYNEIVKSYELEMKISKYFIINREELNDKQIELYELYSEFLILFYDINSQDNRKLGKINARRYYLQYFYSKSVIDNFYTNLPNYLNKSEKTLLLYAASRCLRTLLNNYGSCLQELFEFINFTVPGNIYYDAIEFNKKFLEFLNEKSEIFLFYLQLNSGSSINLITNELTSRISMLDKNSIKNHLFSTIPKYGIKIKCNTFFNACVFSELKITCISESSLFGKSLNNSELNSKNDINYNRRFRIAKIIQQENFSNFKFSMNFDALFDKNIKRSYEEYYSQSLCPLIYYRVKNKEEMVKIIKKNKCKAKEETNLIIKGDSGIALIFFLTRGKKKLMKLLNAKDIDFSSIFKDPSIMASEDLSIFINELHVLCENNYVSDDENEDVDNELIIKYEDSEYPTGKALGIPTVEKF